MNGRDLIALLGGTAALSWPQGARAQRQDRRRRIGIVRPTDGYVSCSAGRRARSRP